LEKTFKIIESNILFPSVPCSAAAQFQMYLKSLDSSFRPCFTSGHALTNPSLNRKSCSVWTARPLPHIHSVLNQKPSCPQSTWPRSFDHPLPPSETGSLRKCGCRHFVFKTGQSLEIAATFIVECPRAETPKVGIISLSGVRTSMEVVIQTQ